MNNPIKSQIAANRERFEKITKEYLPHKRWCKFSKEAEEIGYKEDRDGVICGESRKGEFKVKWGGNKSHYYYTKNLIEELPQEKLIDRQKSFLTTSQTSLLQTAIAAVEGLRIKPNIMGYLSDKAKGSNKTILKVVELLKGGIDN